MADEPLGAPGRLRRRPRVRLPARPRRARTPTLDAEVEALARAGHPTITLAVHGAADLGRIFFFAEFATAVAGWVLGINPFDQPNVQEAKDNTAKVLEAGEPARAWTPRRPARSCSRRRGRRTTWRSWATSTPSEEFDAAIAELRARDPRRTRRPPPRSATARASCTRPASSTRAGRRPACSCSSSTTATRTWRSRAPATASAPQERAGDRRPADPARPRPAGRAGPARGRLAEASRPHRAMKEAPLMQLGFVGLGKMGGNMVHRIHRDSDHEVVAFDFSADAVERGRGQRRDRAPRRSRTWSRSSRRRAPSGSWCRPATRPSRRSRRSPSCSSRATRSSTAATRRWTDDKRRAGGAARRRGIHYVDVGTSGGVWGLEVGYCMMVGGARRGGRAARADPRRARAAHDRGARPGLGPLRPDRRGPLREDGPQRRRVRDDAGLRRGLRALRRQSEYELDNAKIAHLWMQGSVVRSWLCELAALAFEQEGNDLGATRAATSRTPARAAGRSRTRSTSAIPMPVITAVAVRALLARAGRTPSRRRCNAALRNQFGGHAVKHDRGAEAAARE